MTGKRDFRMPVITLGVSEWYTSSCFNFRVRDAFPPRSGVSRFLETLKPCADFSSLEIEVLDGNFSQYNPVLSTLKTTSGGKSLSIIIFLNSAVNAWVASMTAPAASPLISMQWICERCLNLANHPLLASNVWFPPFCWISSKRLLTSAAIARRVRGILFWFKSSTQC